MPPRRFAILGTRGIPARYGGFETFAEELSTRLVALGHRVTVYGRERHPEPTYRGVNLIYLPPIRNKYVETIAHTLFSTVYLLFHRQDAVLYCNAANALFTYPPRLAGMGVALNVDGLERNRKKWNQAAKLWYRISERLATFLPDAVVTDALEIQRYYASKYGKTSTMIPYGAETGRTETQEAVLRLGLAPHRYFLYVSRMEPENNALYVREAFESVETDYQLALIGDAPYAREYIASVRDTRDPRIVMPGSVYGPGYVELGSHCFAYIHATEVGGTHPALIENMARGALTLYLDTPENAEVAGGAGIPFDRWNLAARIRAVLDMTEEERQCWRERAVDRVRERYSWDAVTRSYEQLLESLVKK